MKKQTVKSGKQTQRSLVLMSIMIGMFLSAIEATIVATAMPNIVADLGGFSHYSWVFSAYLLMMATTVLIFGKLSDIYGRKPIYIIGISIFLIGSLLSGLSQTMKMLIFSRFIQGAGAGALMPVATTIVGDMYHRKERAKIQGYLSSVWGISAVLGPLLGGFFVETLHWRYVFLMNIPLGIIAILGITVFFHETIKKEYRSIDYTGSFLVILTVSLLMFLLVEGGVTFPWISPIMICLVLIISLSFFLFIQQERKAKDPLMPLFIWRHRFILIANIISLIAGIILIGVTSYLPAFVQGVMGRSATIAGFSLTTMSIGWPIASTVAGRTLLVIGYRKTSLIGALFLIIGSTLFVFLSPENGPVWAGMGSFMVGSGMGLVTTSFIVGIQSQVNWELRGIATATNIFMRSLGSAIGVAFLGGILNNYIHQLIARANLSEEVSVDTVNELLNNQSSFNMSYETITVLKKGLTGGLHTVYLWLLILSIISFVLICFMPKGEKEPLHEDEN